MTTHEDIERTLAWAEESIEAAEMLLAGGKPAFSTSRAYYAMFCTAQALLLSLGLAFSKHGAVIGKYGEHFAKTGELDPKYHRYVMEAFRTRGVADYEHMKDVNEADVQTHIARAKEFVKAAREYLEQHSTEADA